MTATPKPLAEVRLRAEVRKVAFQLLGPAPEHPEFEHYKTDQTWVQSWDRAPKEEPKNGKPKRSRKKKT